MSDSITKTKKETSDKKIYKTPEKTRAVVLNLGLLPLGSQEAFSPGSLKTIRKHRYLHYSTIILL